MGVALDLSFLNEISSVNAHDESGRLSAQTADTALVARSRTGDFSAFEELVRRYRNDVYSLSFHFLRDREEAWDASQEVFYKAYRALGRFRGDAGFKTWLLRITANHCKDQFKKRRLRTVPLDEVSQADSTAAIAGPDDAMQAKELGEAIIEALNTLSAKHRTAFVLREFEGLSYEEMSHVMECSLGTVMSRLYHARKKLQLQLRRMGIVEDNG